MITENGQRLSGSWEMDQIRLTSYPKLTAGKVVKHVTLDPMVGVWVGMLAVLAFVGMLLYQHQNVDHSVGQLAVKVQKNQDDGAKLTKEVKALEP
jgi:hypothetical protein